MATIVGGVATSHTPTIAFAKDAGKFEDPVWKPIFDGYKPVQDWFRAKRPDVLVYIYNDHMTSFFDHYRPAIRPTRMIGFFMPWVSTRLICSRIFNRVAILSD